MSAAPARRIELPFWTADRVANALSSVATTNPPAAIMAFHRVWTDTRTIEPGDLFVALVGEKFDAHDFLHDAVAKGATGVVVSRPAAAKGLGVPAFQVSDTLAALGALGTYRRRAWGKPVVGVVGTNGKTSTKELVRAALGSVLEVHATTGNLNNLVGVPLTLLAIPDAADIAVVEMGTNQPGEIPRLRAIVEPDVVVVTSIAEEHLEGLGNLEGVMREEMAATNGVPLAIVPASQPNVADAARRRAKYVVAAGLDEGDLAGAGASVDDVGQGHMTIEGVDVVVPPRGIHNLRNAMLAFAAARAAGVPIADAARGVAAMPVPPMRVNVERLAPRDARVVTAADTEALWTALSSRVAPDAVILLKGSRGMRLERLLKPIAEWAGQGSVATPDGH